MAETTDAAFIEPMECLAVSKLLDENIKAAIELGRKTELVSMENSTGVQ